MIASPTVDATEVNLVDWLELNALFDAQGRGYVDQIINSFDFEADFDDPDVADADAAEEDIRNRIAAEVERRRRNLGNSYPFDVYSVGEIIRYTGCETHGRLAYLVSLLAEHSWKGGLLSGDSRYNGVEQVALRNAFEVIAALAAAGYTRGPAFLIGTNRSGAVALLQRVQEICDHVGEGRARPAVEDFAPPNANDDGVDVIAVQLEQDGPPHSGFYFCQSASGANFREKPITNEIPNFVETWFEIAPVNRRALVVVAAMLSRSELTRQSRRLGHILHRDRVPFYADIGAELAEQGIRLVDCWARRGEALQLLESYAARTGACISGAA